MKQYNMKTVTKYKLVSWCVLLVAGVGISALLGSVCFNAAKTAWRVSESLQAWENMGLRVTAAWRVREFLARLSWLGPLRPNPPRDPLSMCGVQAEASWWSLLVRASQTTQLNECLQEEMKTAVEDHAAFQSKVVFILTSILAAVTCTVFASVKSKKDVCGAPRSKTCGKNVVTVSSEADEIVKVSVVAEEHCDDLSLDEYQECQEDNHCDDQSSDEYEECQEEIRCNDLSSDEYEECQQDIPCKEQSSDEHKECQEDKHCDDQSSFEHRECQEDICLLPPENNKEYTDEALCDLPPLPLAETQITNNETKEPAQTQGKVNKKKKKRRKKTGKADSMDDDSEWQIVNRKNKKRANRSVQREQKEEKTKIYPKEAPCAKVRPKKEKPAKSRHKAATMDDSREHLRQQWREDTVQVLVAVPPKRRQHIIGPQGNTIRQLRQKYPAVHVSVPLPQDLTSRHVTLEGPKSQVAAASRDIMGQLEAIDALIREAARRREGDNVRVLMEVEPKLRRRLVGPGGERLVRLSQEHPSVRVSVPHSTDTHTRTVTLRGPPDEVAAVEACLKATLQAAQRQRELQKARKRHYRKRTADK